MTDPVPSLLAVDWGTTSLRAYLLDGAGGIVERAHFDRGILSVEAGAFERTFAETCLALLRGTSRPPILMCGMVGARQGWVEAPYRDCPCRLDELADGAVSVSGDGWSARILPGLRATAPSGAPDVMRGEETQIAGALALASVDDAAVCIPGTHSKWCRVAGGVVTTFATFMTGELFALLSRHSILARQFASEWSLDGDAFRAGVDAADSDAGLLHDLFGVRTKGLAGIYSEAQQPGYLSGLLVGTELKRARALPDMAALPTLLVAAGRLRESYCLAMDHLQVTYQTVDAEAATVAGLGSAAGGLPGITPRA